MKKQQWITGLCILVAGMGLPACLVAQGNAASARQALIFSTVRGTDSRPDSMTFSVRKEDRKVGIHITGARAASFTLISSNPAKIGKGQKVKLVLVFSPASDFIGVAKAIVQVTDATGGTIREFDLRGLSLKGLEGANEPPLVAVFDALGYQVDPGWIGLAHNLKPDPEGEEIHASFFRKAGSGPVDIQPVARFSPDYALSFGYYTNSSRGPLTHQVGSLAKTTTGLQDQMFPQHQGFPQHQTLFPGIVTGTHSFDPDENVFGVYTTSPTHSSYTTDDWNLLLYPDKAGHAARIYPAKDQYGQLIANTYLLCFEEAQNGDYQDYVFVMKNVKPLSEEEEYTALMNGRDLDGWNIFLQHKGLDNDQEHNFSVEDGTVHVSGKELGYIRTKKSFTNYHFKVEFKWGEKRWPPRDTARRDAGICYNIPENEPDSIWPKSIECQIQEGDVGDFWLLSFSTIEVDGKRNQPSSHTRMIKKKDGEKPYGEWNTVEVISYDGRCIQMVNGLVVNDGNKASIKNGRILLQSEFSEVYYRNARISKL